MSDEIVISKEDASTILRLVGNIQKSLEDLSKDIQSAFPRDEDNNIDYHGHRLYHRKANEREELDRKRYEKLRSSVLAWAAIGLASILTSALVSAYITPVLQLIGRG
jgi:hypothetical protein